MVTCEPEHLIRKNFPRIFQAAFIIFRYEATNVSSILIMGMSENMWDDIGGCGMGRTRRWG